MEGLFVGTLEGCFVRPGVGSGVGNRIALGTGTNVGIRVGWLEGR